MGHSGDGLSLHVTGLNPDALQMCGIGNGSPSPPTTVTILPVSSGKTKRKDGSRTFSFCRRVGSRAGATERFSGLMESAGNIPHRS